jgi:alpha-1,3-rhamnosyl/mannosyltransferase
MTAPLRVILNDRPLRATLTGVGYYTQQILRGVPSHDPGVEVHPLVATHVRRSGRQGSPGIPSGSAVSPRTRRGKPAWLRCLLDWGQAVYFRRQVARAARYDLYHEPNHIPMPCDLPTVTTVHDLSVVEHPEWHPRERVRLFERHFERGLRRAARLIAVSEFTKARLVAGFGLAPERICVTYQAPREAFRPRDRDETRSVLEQFRLRAGFFLFVGTLEPRKNIGVLLEAYHYLPAALRRRLPLVIVGAWGWRSAGLAEQIERATGAAEVRHLGYVDDRALACLYSACTAFVWPSLYEGFGLPPLEAMACGAPVVVSDTSALPEVVGSAGVRLDPTNRPAWTAALERMAEDTAWRGMWVQRGLTWAAEFSWQRCCRATATCYQVAAGRAQ